MDEKISEKFVTPQSQALHDALSKRGINSMLEYSDGNKHVDIAIPDAHIYIEVDGLQHFTNPKRIIADFGRTYYSDADGFNTFHIPNIIIEQYLEDVANALAEVAMGRKNK